MKKLFLHGELGDKFGFEWSFAVSSAVEAFEALFANNPEIQKHIYKKAQDNITYGAKYEGSEDFIKEEEGLFNSSKDIHIFPIPSGSGFVGSLVLTAATTAISIAIQKKLADTFNRDESITQNQSKSFLLDGGDNRFKQGQTIPLGYGRMKVGSSVISFSTANYEYSSSQGRVLGFNGGLIVGLVPKYSEFYNEDIGLLMSTLLYDGNQSNTITDPKYAEIQKKNPPSAFGVIDSLYGRYVPAEQYKNNYTNTRQGNDWGGWVHYDFNFAKGLDKSRLQNWTNNGNWYPSHLMSFDDEDKAWFVSAKDIQRTGVVALQSLPALETSQEAYDSNYKKFYPILFNEGKSPQERDVGTVKVVGTRWRDGEKQKGGNWHRFESVTVFKAIDLLCEGPIEGLCDKDGKVHKFSRNPTLASNERNTADDFLQGIYLDDIPIKETNSDKSLDAYNINEFDVDIARDLEGQIGSDDQLPLDDRYKFVSNTKEINSPLYGPRSADVGTVLSLSDKEANPFVMGTKYKEGDYFTFTEDESQEELVITTVYDLSLGYEYGEYYESIKVDPDKRFYTSISHQIINHNGKYYVPYHGWGGGQTIDDYAVVSGEGVPYQQGDKARAVKDDMINYRYFSWGSSASRFRGVVNRDNYLDFAGSINDIFMVADETSDSEQGTSTASFYMVTGLNQDIVDNMSSYDQNFPGEAIGRKIKTQALGAGDEPNGSLTMDIFHVFNGHKNYPLYENDEEPFSATQQEIINNFFSEEEDVSPSRSPHLWQEIIFVDPLNVYIQSRPGAVSEDYYVEELDLNEDGFTQYYINITDAIFMPISTNDKAKATSAQEEFYISHSIVNPEVRQIVVSLQIDELYFVYPGDEVEVTYEVGKAWAWITGALAGYHGVMAIVEYVKSADFFTTVPKPNVAAGKKALVAGIKHTAMAAFWGTLTYFIADGIFFKMGTKVENSGEFWPNRAMFRVKYGNEGETLYSTDFCFHGVCTNPYRKDVKIFLPDNPENKDRIIKVYKLNRERNPVVEGEMAVRYKSKVSLNAITEITPTVLSYPNSVVVGTRLNARDMGRVPTRSYDLKLKKVRVPSNYNPEKRRYTGFWDGLFKGQEKLGDEVLDKDKEWTDNPAWCLYDLISNKNYGVGRFGINFENIDRWTLYKIAKYCDEYIPTGYSAKYAQRSFEVNVNNPAVIKISGSTNFLKEFFYPGKKIALFFDDGVNHLCTIDNVNTRSQKIILDQSLSKFTDNGKCAVEFDYPLLEPRYTVNAVMTTEQNAFSLINQFCNIFRAFAYWSNGAINFYQDEKSEPLMFFHNGNISQDGFSYVGTPRTERINTCKVRYFDKYNKFRPKLEFSEDRESIANNNIIETTLDGFGITSKSQAKRAGEFLVKTNNLETELVTFKTSIIGSYLKPGDVIEVLDKKRTIGRCAGKISDLKMDPEGRFIDIYLDYPVNLKIEPSDRSSWKKLKVYNLSEFETIQTLNEIAGTEVSDQKIDDLRKAQMIELTVNSISKNKEKLRVLSPKYEIIDGEYTFTSAFYDAKRRDGSLAGIGDESDQEIIETMLQDGDLLWLGGAIKQLPPPEELLWLNAQGCSGFNIDYGNWLEGYPPESEGIIDDINIDGPINPDTVIQENEILTDNPGYTPPDIYDNFTIATDPDYTDMLLGSDFMCITGSTIVSNHGKWLTMPSGTKMGYVLERQLEDNSFTDFINLRNKSFMIEEETELAIPKKYRVNNIKEETNGIYIVEATEYNQEKYDNIENSIALTPPVQPTFYTEKVIDNHKSIKVEHELIDGLYRIKCSWQTTDKPAYFRIEYLEHTRVITTVEVPRDPETNEYEHTLIYKDVRDSKGLNARVYSIY